MVGRYRFGGPGQSVVVGLMIGITSACLIGAVWALLTLRGDTSNTSVRKLYPPDLVYGVLAYDLTDPAPTGYGWFTAEAAHLENSDGPTKVDLSLSVENRQDGPINLPTLDELRLVNTDGVEATYLSGGWGGDSIARAHSISSGEFRFAAPAAGGMLLLEYRERGDGAPIRVAVGYALERVSEASIDAGAR